MDVQEKFRMVGEIEKLAQEIAKFLETKNISVGHAFSALAIEIVRLSKVMGMPPDAFIRIFDLIEEKKKCEHAQKKLMEDLYEGKSGN